MGTRRKIVFLLAVLTILACLLPALATPAKAQASLSVQILSYDRIGIDSNNPGGVDKQGNPVGPDKSNIQASGLHPYDWTDKVRRGWQGKALPS